MNVTMCCCGMGSSELRDGRTRTKCGEQEGLGTKKSAELKEQSTAARQQQQALRNLGGAR